MEMDIFFEVRAALLENAVQLVDDDGDHHLLSQADEVALEFGYSRVHVWRRKHSSCGGGSQRLQVLHIWLHSSVVLKLEPIVDWQPEQEASPVRGCFVPLGDVPSWCITPGVLVRESHGQGQGPGDAHRVGVHRYGGKGVPVVVGSRVRLPGDSRVWVVEQMYRSEGGHRMRLFYDNRKAAKRTNVDYYVQANAMMGMWCWWKIGHLAPVGRVKDQNDLWLNM